MEIALQQYIDYFRIALEIALPIKQELIMWADDLILKTSDSHILELAIELSTSRNKSIQDTLMLLENEYTEDNWNQNIPFCLVVAKISTLYPDFGHCNFYIMQNLAQWYRLNGKNHTQRVHFDFSFDMYGFEFIACQRREIWHLYMDESKIPGYYQELMDVGRDYIKHLPCRTVNS